MLHEHDFASLVPPQTPGMLRVAAALVGQVDAEDVTQEAILQAWRSWSTLRSLESLRPWLLRITINVCHQWRRRSYGRKQSLTQGLPDEGAQALAVLQPDAGSSEHTTALDVRRVVNRLEADLRIIVVLRFSGLPADLELLSFVRIASQNSFGPARGQEADHGPGQIELKIPGMSVSTPAFTVLQASSWPPSADETSEEPVVGAAGSVLLEVSFQGTGKPNGKPATLSISQIQFLTGGIDGNSGNVPVLPSYQITLPMS